ncbi:MAG: translocation/assembly module TamB domain-containing protein [Fimbriimonadaceae bacterium]
MLRALALIRLVVSIAPVLLLAVWGLSYLRACWGAVLAPGVPIALHLNTPGGALSFRAASYSFNPRSGFLVVNAPLLRDPAGRTLAAAQLAEASGIDVFDLSRTALRVHLFGVKGRLVRDADGRFEIQKFIASHPTQAKGFPFDVSIDHADIEVLDRKGSADWVRRIVGTNVSVAGVGNQWLAAADVSCDQVGSGRIALTRTKSGGLVIRTVAANWKLADLGRHILSTLSPAERRSFGAVDAANLSVSGPMELTLPASAPPSFSFVGSAQALQANVSGYRASNLKFVGRITGDGAEGAVSGAGSGVDANLRGWINWQGNRIRTVATGGVSLASIASLPASARKLIPAGVSGRALAFQGSVTFDSRNGIGAAGSFTAAQGAYKSDALDRVAGEVRVGGQTVWARVASAHYRSAPVTGEVAMNWKTRQITAAAKASHLSAAIVLQRFPVAFKKIKGTPSGMLSAFALMTGPLAKPTISFRIAGYGDYSEADLPRPVKIERALAEGSYRDGKITVARLRARTPAGAITAVGSIDLPQRTLAFDVDGRGLDVGDFTTSVSGLASVSGAIAGTFDEPRFDGQVEGYDLTYQGNDVALTTAHVTARPEEILASSLDVVVGSSQISGRLAVALPSKQISGAFSSKALQVGDFLGEPFAGLVAIQTSDLSGTVDDPHFTVTAMGKDLLAQELQIADLDAHATLAGHHLSLDTLQAHTADGLVLANGEYDLDAQSGHVAMTGAGLNLAAVLPAVQKTNRTALAGIVGGRASLAFANRALTSVVASGTLASVKANGTDLGDGVWNVSGDGHTLSGSAQASFGTRFLALENATVNLDAATLDSNVVASNLTLQNVYQFASPYLAAANASPSQRFALFDGDVKLLGHVSGKWANPDLVVSSLETDNLSYNGITFGDLTASGSRLGGVWSLAAVNLTDGAASASAHGTIDEAGDTNLDGEIHNFDIAKLGGAFPGLPPVDGVVSSSFLATGPTSRPQVRATLDAESVAVQGRPTDFGMNLATVTLGSAGIDASGAVTYEGFHGQLVAHVPFNYPFTIPEDTPISATLTLNQRPLSDIAPYAPTLDPKRIQGAINGSLALTGVRDALHLSGGINIRAADIGFRALDPASKPQSPKYIPLTTELKDLVLSLGVQDTAVTADMSVKSNQAGSIDGQVNAKLAALEELLNQHTFADLDTWLASPITGKVAFNDLAMKESNKLLTSSFALNGGLTVAGSLASPAISGDLAVSNLSTTIPGLTAQSAAGNPATIDPKFNIGIELQNPGHITTALAGIDLTGRGHIGGTLSQMDATALLAVVRGELRLPGGKVSLTPGGTVHPTYQVDASGISDAHVTVDLYGDSHVTAVRNGDVAERYDVHLDVRGDLLVPDQVVFIATSDPPDLSQDQILALLGRTDLLNALGSGTTYAQGERQFQTAALSFAVPSLFDPITSRLAAGLGLDYLSIEYNALDQTSILASKTLGHGFSFQVRRQISVPTPGFPLSYDYRLVYQLPTRSRIIRRFSFFFGADQLTPWKIGLQYGQRF